MTARAAKDTASARMPLRLVSVGIDRHRGVVAVRGDQVPQPSRKPRRTVVVVVGAMAIGRAVLKVGIRLLLAWRQAHVDEVSGLALRPVGSNCTMAMATFRKPCKAD